MSEPTYTLKARDPLAMGLVELRSALRAHDVRRAVKYFETLVEVAAGLPIASEAELRAAREIAGDMEVWRFHRGPAPQEATNQEQNVAPYPGPPHRVVP